jgi:hypothetical protein
MSWLTQAKALYVKGRNSMLYYPIENKVFELTSNQHCDDADKIRKDIVDATFQTIEQWTYVSKALWERLNDKDGWRHAYKGLLLMEHLIVFGAKRALSEFTQPDAIAELKPLLDFEYVSPVDMRDHGKMVRDTAQRVIALLQDPERIEELREQAKKHKILGFDPLDGKVIKTGDSPRRNSADEEPISRRHSEPPKRQVRETAFSPASPTFDEQEPRKRIYDQTDLSADEVRQLQRELQEAYLQIEETNREMEKMKNKYEQQLQRVTAERDHYQKIMANYE